MTSQRRLARKIGRNFIGTLGPGISWAMRASAERFMARTRRYTAHSTETLDRILALNGRTEFGRHHGLDGANPRRAFAALPLTTYKDYAPYIERIAAGEPNQMSGEPAVYFSTTSGTSGPPKMIPVTGRQMRMAVRTRTTSFGLALRAGVLGPMRGRFMTIMSEHVGSRTAGGVPRGAATTGGFRQLGNIGEMLLSSPADVARLQDQATARYLHLLFGLREEHLWTIVAFFPATILFALHDLQTRGPELLRDLADGSLNPDLDLPADVRTGLQARLQPQRARARALGKLLERGELTLSGAWPDVGAVLTATGGAFQFYVDQLRPLLGDVKIFSPVYSASEGTMALGFSAESPAYLLLPDLLYVEFLPEESMDDPRARPIAPWEAERGHCYEVVITTLAGFTRYRLHDTVRVVEFRGQTPVIEFVERLGQVIDIIGEKTAEHHVAEALARACHNTRQQLVDYFVTADTGCTPAGYVLAIESWHCDDPAGVAAFAADVERALRKLAPDYDDERVGGGLAPMQLVLLKAGAFERYRGRRQTAGAPASQVKVPHVVPDPGFLAREFGAEIEERVAGHGD